MNMDPCTTKMLRDEADQMFDGSLVKLRDFIETQYESRPWGGATWHLQEDLARLGTLIAGGAQ
jgi:hypothetical protein